MEFLNNEEIPKTVMVYGETGSGKSTFVKKYCDENGLKPVCVDYANTNFTGVPRVKIDTGNHIKANKNILNIIKELKDSEYDTIIEDGYTRLLNIYLGNGAGLSKYSERAELFKRHENAIVNSGLNWIVVGQPDLRAKEQTEDNGESPKPILSVNELMNEQYHCTRQGNQFFVECEKNRTGKPYEKKEVTQRRMKL